MTTNPKVKQVNSSKETLTIDAKNKTRHLFSSPFYKKKFEIRYQSSTPLNNQENKLTIKQFSEGFTAFEEQEHNSTDYSFGEYWINYSFRKLGVTNPAPARPVCPQLDRINSRSMRKGVRRSMEAWEQFMKPKEDIECSFENYSLMSKLSSDVSTMSAERDRSEYYIPLAFKENETVIGGVYAHFGTVEGKRGTNNKRKQVTEQPIKEIFTGSCMFGATLYGVDQHGEKHSLTCPRYEMPADRIIQRIIHTDTLHPDEVMNQKMFMNLIPFYKIACQTDTPSINYHLPVPNYIIYGLNKFLKGQITKEALDEYIKCVVNRGQIHRKYLEKLSADHNLNIRTTSTLSPLNLEEGAPENTLEGLLKTLDLSDLHKNNYTSEELSVLRTTLLTSSIEFLTQESGVIGQVWSHIKANIDAGSHKLDLESEDSLIQLNYIDYSANLATSAAQYNHMEVCDVFPAQESPIQLTYKKMFANEFGAIMFMNWVSPILVTNKETGHRIFFSETFIDEINQVINAGIIEQSLIQTAAIALDSPQLAGQTAIKAQAILSEHEMAVQLEEELKHLEQLSAS